MWKSLKKLAGLGRRVSRRRGFRSVAAGENLESRQVMTFQGFAAPTFVENAGFPPRQVATGDLNRDGIPDLVTADTGNSVVKFALGRGDGSFGEMRTLTPGGTNVSNPLVTDFNRDGRLDIGITSRNLGYSMKVFLGNGNGTFSGPSTSLISSYLVGQPVVADLNGDGAPDLATPTIGVSSSTFMAYSVANIAINNGNGTFRTIGSVQLSLDQRTDETVMTGAAGDVNGDGRQDVVFAHRGSGHLSLLRGNGNGTFHATQRIDIGRTAPTAVRLADVNGDNRQDIVVTKSSANCVGVGLNNGSDGFTFTDVGVGSNPQSLAVGDVNRDGRVDVVTANLGSDNLTLLAGNGNGTFAAAANSSAGDSSNPRIHPTDVTLTDVNRDGQLDALVGHGYQGSAGDNFRNKSTGIGVQLGRDVVSPNLKITGVSLVNALGATVSIPRSGDLLAVRVTFQTTGLVAGTTYNVAIQAGNRVFNYNLNWGAGLNGTGSWILETGRFTWGSGRQLVGAQLDSTSRINEAFEDDNFLGRIYGQIV